MRNFISKLCLTVKLNSILFKHSYQKQLRKLQILNLTVSFQIFYRKHSNDDQIESTELLSGKTTSETKDIKVQQDKQEELPKELDFEDNNSLSLKTINPKTQMTVQQQEACEGDWRQLVDDKSLLSSLCEADIRRQEVIHELIQTERHHCSTLTLMRQVYVNGIKCLNNARHTSRQQQHQQITEQTQKLTTSSQDANNLQVCIAQQHQQQTELIDLCRLFPALDELIELHEAFYVRLRSRQLRKINNNSSDKCDFSSMTNVGVVDEIGDILASEFNFSNDKIDFETTKQQASNCKCTCKQQTTNNINCDDYNTTKISQPKHSDNQNNCPKHNTDLSLTGRKYLSAYARFCGQHYDAIHYYKRLMRYDKNFKLFIEVSKSYKDCKIS